MNANYKFLWLTVLACAMILAGCGKYQAEPTAPVSAESTVTQPTQEDFSFADVGDLEFVFASGAGSWGTVLRIHEDGSFEGSYSDSDMETAPEYPNGSCYYSEFFGRFTQPEKVTDSIWRFQIAELSLRYEEETEEIKDRVRYRYSAPHGLSESGDWFIYLPGAQLEDLPKPFLDWVHLSSWDETEQTELPFYGLYNQKEEFGFSSYEPECPTFSFADVEGLEFWCSSGAGGWGTVLYIHEDGSFEGVHHNSDMEVGPGYPNGTLYYCEFSGSFTQPEQVNDFTYRFTLAELTEARERGDSEIKDGIRYVYADPYGLEDAEDLYLYLPGAKRADMPENHQYWSSGIWDEALPNYGLYNEKGEDGFIAFVPTSPYELVIAEIEEAEKEDAVLKDLLLNDKTASQADMNSNAQKRYEIWDDLLNREWALLKEHLDEEPMRELTTAQLAWIQEKEAAANEAAAEVEGGSLTPVYYYGKSAEMTRERVYFLAEYLK